MTFRRRCDILTVQKRKTKMQRERKSGRRINWGAFLAALFCSLSLATNRTKKRNKRTTFKKSFINKRGNPERDRRFSV